MKSTLKLILVAIMGSCLVSGLANAGWLPGLGSLEGQNTWNNVLTTPTPGSNYSFDISGTSLATWYWDNANGIAFEEHAWVANSGGVISLESMKFQFSQPITSFQFTTPLMEAQGIFTGNSLHWDMSADNGDTWTSLWSYTGVDENYQTFTPQTLSAIPLATPTNQIRLKYYTTAATYCAATRFTGANGGSMTVTTAIPEPAMASLLALAGLAGLARRRR
jgi:MprA protease rhombosortase-interaction domain-containing protein